MTTRPSKMAESRAVYLPVPEHPGLMLVCTIPDQYPPELLDQLQQHLAQWTIRHPTPSPASVCTLTPQQIKELLRSIHDPAALARHPVVAHCTVLPPTDYCTQLVQRLTTAIHLLETPTATAEPDIRGTILRMRYLERRKTRTIMKLLHLSERHYYRLQAAALAWVAAYLSTHPPHQERECG